MRRHYDRPRGSGRGNPVCRSTRRPEISHHEMPPSRKARYHRNRNVGIHDPEPPPHPRGNFGRCKRRLRRHERGYAVGRIGGGQVPRRNGAYNVGYRRRNGTSHRLRFALPRQPFQNQKQGGRGVARNVRYGNRYRRESNRRHFKFGHDRPYGFPLPRADGYNRHGNRQGGVV